MNTVATTSRSTSVHHAGMMKRRHAIIEAAHRIISKEGELGLTMRRIASEAGVSQATPYNLFGSKEHILRAVFDADFVHFDRYFKAKAGTDPLGRLFDIVDFSWDAFRERPTFYKALFRALQGGPESEVRSSEWLRTAFIESLVSDAIGSGHVLETYPRLIAHTWVRMMRSAILEWVAGEIAMEDAQREVGLAIAMFLRALVPSEHQPRLALLQARYEKAS